ncbi:carbohydrate ABC transporter permease [Halalkalibacter sp. APA_J-10(15)]|uniref:carbohydrate ABC transporter permease n=1 Tax=unclassified Halalkalibacter TaxID=2893063 RepID=UPI001FF34199|nr:sugar ABC transporter permease [Halalkalibacter sp. APA_J-10(15)]MCK0471719.1 sugar ABC transporter permease [Halalkalibacter sp. APA_J-10(15)]
MENVSTTKRNKLTSIKQKKYNKKVVLWCWLFVLPNLILFALFQGWPIVINWYYSMSNWSGLSAQPDFIGLANFRELISDQYFWNAYKNVFMFAAGTVPSQLILGLLFAVVLNNPKLKFANVYRTLIFIPVVTSASIIGIIMGFIWSPNGGVNYLLISMGIINVPIDFLGSMTWSMPTVIIVSVWMSVGINMVFWLAGLQGIPRELYEAAYIDGAGYVKTFFKVTVPLLIPIGAVILLFNFAFSLRVFDLIKTLTDGGPFFSTDVVSTYVYRHAFSGEVGQPRMGYASAAGLFFGFTVITIMATLQLIKYKLKRK